MADYYSLLSRAVQGLDKSTSDARRALYDRVRTVMMEQLHSQQPTLSDLVKQQLALEEAIKKVEAEEDRKERSLVPGHPPLRMVKRPPEERERAEHVGKERELAARALADRVERHEQALNANRLPTDGRALFLACESIRQEAGGRLTIIGAVTSGDMLVPSGTQLVTLASLAFLFVFRDGQGTFPGSFSLMAPSGQTLVDQHKLPNSVKVPGDLVVNIAPFETKELGEFRAVARLADQDFVRTFGLAQARK
jgi:hypothetical protein